MLSYVVLSAVLVTIFSNGVLSDGMGAGIPTKEEQLKLLKNMEELFNEVKVLVTDEGVATDAAVIKDVQSTVDRSLEYLDIMEDFALLKLTCSSHGEDCDKVKVDIKVMANQCENNLQYCLNEATEFVHNNTQIVTAATDEAMNKGKLMMSTLSKCSKKPGLHQISCYKKVVMSDAFPVKSILLETMQIHKTGHLESIAIRWKAGECVDEALTICHEELSEILKNASDMCT